MLENCRKFQKKSGTLSKSYSNPIERPGKIPGFGGVGWGGRLLTGSELYSDFLFLCFVSCLFFLRFGGAGGGFGAPGGGFSMGKSSALR